MSNNLYFYYIILFLFGSSLSSFYYLFFYRRERKEDFIFKRSYCENCKTTLSIVDIIPVASYIFNKGKCHYCKNEIGIDKFLTELIVGLLSLLFGYKHGFSLSLILIIMELNIIFYIGFIDYLTGYIYNIDVGLLFIINCIYKILYNEQITYSLIISLILGLIFLLIYFFTHMIGLGDCIYVFVCGFILHSIYDAFLFFNVTFLSAAIISIILLVTKRKMLKDSISFGPFISVGLLTALFFR